MDRRTSSQRPSEGTTLEAIRRIAGSHNAD
jgi:hypothetical protein